MSQPEASIVERIHAVRAGDATPPPAPEESAAPEAPPEAPAAAEAPQEAPEAVESPQVDEGSPEAPAAAETPESGDSEAIEVSSLDELAEYLGTDVSELYNLAVPSKANGQPVTYTLGELKDLRRTQDEMASRETEMAELREKLDVERQQMEQTWRRRATEAQGVLEAVEEQFKADYEAIDWNELRRDQPEEWAARQHEFRMRRERLDAARTDAVTKLQEHEQEALARHNVQLQEVVAAETDALLKAIPEWRDPDVAAKGKAELSNYLQQSGFSKDEISQLVRHELVVMARKAMMYDEHTGKSEVAKKRVLKIGKKTVRPGAPRGKIAAQEDRTTALRKRLHESGRVEDAAALIGARRKG